MQASIALNHSAGREPAIDSSASASSGKTSGRRGDTAPLPALGIATACALLAGVLACLLLPGLVPWPLSALLLAIGTGLWMRGGRRGVVAAVFLIGFALAGLHAQRSLAQQLPLSLERSDAIVTGRVVELPQVETARTRFRLRVDRDARQLPALRGRLLQLAWYDTADAPSPTRLSMRAGSHWRLPVRLRAPRGLRNPGGIDSEKHALVQRIAAQGHVRDPELVRQLQPPAGLDAWRDAMSRRIAFSVARPSSRFVRALALGDTRGLSDTDWELLRNTGLTHLIAISGFHVGIVAGVFALLAGLVWRLLPQLGRWWPRPLAAAMAAVLGAAGYAAIAGFALPTVRTLLMIAVVAALRISRRAMSAAQALALAAIAILLVDPLAALTAGFWLSFLGVGWLLWCLPAAGTRIWRDVARGFLSAQGVATLGLLPLTVVLFGQASLAGPFANLLAVPWWSLVVVPLALLGTALEAIQAGLGAWSWQLASLAFDAPWPLFERLGRSPMSVWWLPEPHWYALPLAMLGAFWMLLPRGVPGKTLAALLLLPLLLPPRGQPEHGDAEVVLIDVGQGLSVLIRTAESAWLYDTGPAIKDGYDAGERAVIPALRALGVRRLDGLILSHGDNDHAGGAAAVLRAFPTGNVLAPEGVPLTGTQPCRAGVHWQVDGVRLRFLHPPRDFPYLGNEASCVLRIRARHGSALLTGDIGEVIERDLLRRYPRAVHSDVVLVAHHGSNGSSDAGFVDATDARVAVVSSGHGNRFGHPRPQVLARWRASGADVVDTGDGGAIRIRLQAGGPTVETRRATHPRLWDAQRRLQRLRADAGLSYEGQARPVQTED